ncbi:MAG: UTP--glucose-1-phosphate uridylyltransferase [Bdellovibrionales bacterium]|nr:UTP--glucose-1-phosphate uridylyltransferase [Bdellovibrionales bacterium]
MTAITSDVEAKFAPIELKMQSAGCSDLAIRQFHFYFSRLLAGETGMIPESRIHPLNATHDLDEFDPRQTASRDVLDRTCVLKLNGGLGTSMGLDKAKSLLEAREGYSFLDIIVRQIISVRQANDCSIPLILMNSFRTEEDTEAVLHSYSEFAQGQDGLPSSFLQNKVPKILADSAAPVTWTANAELEWCPPGHGDIYTALTQSGILELLHQKGYRYLFISNSDNLGAVLDQRILHYFAEHDVPFLMEVADRTPADRKGGHLAETAEGRLVLRESAQCLPEEQAQFQDIARYRYFNTNSLWLNVEALRTKLAEGEGFLKLPLIRNLKRVDPTDSDSPKVFQLETAMGAAIEQFSGAELLRVPRTRFAPIKKTSDLLAIRSDAFVLQDDYQLTLLPERNGTPPIIDLDEKYFGHVADFDERFPEGAPSLRSCSHLSVTGDISFEKDVIVKGDAMVVNDTPQRKVVTAGTVVQGSTEL